MKHFRIAALIALICCAALLLSGCQPKPDAQEIWDSLVDEETVNYYKENVNTDRVLADLNGDTYCKNCKKISAGYVRICPYCGKYI